MPNFTKQAIMDTFLRLLDQKPLDRITVREIITECQISRNTFYYHFGDIYALLDALLHQDAERLKERHRAGEPWDENLSRVIAYILENRRRARHVYDSLSHSLLERLFYQATEELFFEYVREAAQGLQVPEKDLQAVVYFYQSAFVGAVLDWMRRGMKDDPNIWMKRIHRLMKGNTRRMLENAARETGGAE